MEIKQGELGKTSLLNQILNETLNLLYHSINTEANDACAIRGTGDTLELESNINEHCSQIIVLEIFSEHGNETFPHR